MKITNWSLFWSDCGCSDLLKPSSLNETTKRERRKRCFPFAMRFPFVATLPIDVCVVAKSTGKNPEEFARAFAALLETTNYEEQTS
jgi:hypothetical protein